jgi:catechol 2,3-dioxygenase-like lactoylglutathione lyase family enzyme
MALGKLQVVFDCVDPERVAHFWAEALGYKLDWEWDEASIKWLVDGGLDESELGSRSAASDPDGVGPRLFFQRVPEGKTVKNRVHVDVRATEGQLQQELDRLVSLGATVVLTFDDDFGPIHDHHVVMLDPEGNEFCVS